MGCCCTTIEKEEKYSIPKPEIVEVEAVVETIVEPQVTLMDDIEDGYWMVSTKQHPEHYLYVQNNEEGNARCWEGNPGPQGHFKITKLEDGSFMFYTREWPSYYYYNTRYDHRNC